MIVRAHTLNAEVGVKCNRVKLQLVQLSFLVMMYTVESGSLFLVLYQLTALDCKEIHLMCLCADNDPKEVGYLRLVLQGYVNGQWLGFEH
jgi:hypothetical protein